MCIRTLEGGFCTYIYVNEKKNLRRKKNSLPTVSFLSNIVLPATYPMSYRSIFKNVSGTEFRFFLQRKFFIPFQGGM